MHSLLIVSTAQPQIAHSPLLSIIQAQPRTIAMPLYGGTLLIIYALNAARTAATASAADNHPDVNVNASQATQTTHHVFTTCLELAEESWRRRCIPVRNSTSHLFHRRLPQALCL